MDNHKPRAGNNTVPSFQMSNGYILPEGKLTPNALFVGGIDMKSDENEMRDFFGRYGAVKEVKIITYRGGICKGYGFVYFNEEVNIQSIVDQQIIFKGRKLKLGPAIMKDRSSRFVPPRPVGQTPWVPPTQYCYCSYCSVGGGVPQPSTMLNGSSPYNQAYAYNNFGGVMMSQMPVNYPEYSLSSSLNPYAYQYPPPQWTADYQRAWHSNQNYMDCGVQTLLSVV